MKTLSVWWFFQIEAPIFAVFAVQPCNSKDFLLLFERKNSWLTVPLQTSAFESYLDFTSSDRCPCTVFFWVVVSAVKHARRVQCIMKLDRQKICICLTWARTTSDCVSTDRICLHARESCWPLLPWKQSSSAKRRTLSRSAPQWKTPASPTWRTDFAISKGLLDATVGCSIQLLSSSRLCRTTTRKNLSSLGASASHALPHSGEMVGEEWRTVW